MSDVLKNKKNISEMEELCEISAWIGKMLLVHFFSVIEIDFQCSIQGFL